MGPIETEIPWEKAGGSLRKRKRITPELGVPQGRAGLGPKTLDALPWNEVALPDRMEDAEGFFGLEEVSDVEVVRDPKIKKVQYVVGKVPQITHSEYRLICLGGSY